MDLTAKGKELTNAKVEAEMSCVQPKEKEKPQEEVVGGGGEGAANTGLEFVKP